MTRAIVFLAAYGIVVSVSGYGVGPGAQSGVPVQAETVVTAGEAEKTPLKTSPVKDKDEDKDETYPTEQPLYELKGGTGCDPKKQTCAPLHGKCGVTPRCGGKHICVMQSSGANHGYCLNKCDPASPNCAGGAECVKLSSGTDGACMPPGSAQIDTVCGGQDPKADMLDMAKTCGSGMTCIIFSSGSSEGLCLTKVKACAAGACAAGRDCLELKSGSGICAKDCSSDATVCPKATTCTEIKKKKICGPKAR